MFFSKTRIFFRVFRISVFLFSFVALCFTPFFSIYFDFIRLSTFETVPFGTVFSVFGTVLLIRYAVSFHKASSEFLLCFMVKLISVFGTVFCLCLLCAYFLYILYLIFNAFCSFLGVCLLGFPIYIQ